MTSRFSRALIVGCGYTGIRLARRLAATYQVTAVVRAAASVQTLREAGIETLQVDLDDPQTHARLLPYTARSIMFYLVPPAPVGESDNRLNQLLNRITEPPESLIYISTTGVYGDREGGRVDETTPVSPVSARARRRVSAEDITRIWCTEEQVRRVVLRVPGIYGPGRLPLDRIRSREPVVRSDEAGISNRIHVDDLVSACLGAMNRDLRGIYNVTDGNELSSTEFIRRVAQLANLPPPPEVSMDEAQLTFSPERLSFINESRRIGNERMRRELQVELRYANIDEGIRQSLAEANWVTG